MPFVASTSFHVRYAETDSMRIVHHSNYIVWFEEGRSHYLRAQGTSYADFERDGFFLAVTEVNARYIKPALYDDLVTIRCWCPQARSRALSFQYEVLNSQRELCVTGITQHMCLDREGKIAKIPATWLRWVQDQDEQN
jgi:acyl-CoA thioester hydrolase